MIIIPTLYNMSSQFSTFFDTIYGGMKIRWILFIVMAMMLPISAISKDVNDSILLRCIAEVESNNVSSRIGEQGERSRYQIMPQTWVMYSRTPFRLIGEDEYQREVDMVALQHIGVIKMTIIRRGLVVSVYSIALGWNGGPNKIKYSKNTKDYAERVQNLYNTLSTSQ